MRLRSPLPVIAATSLLLGALLSLVRQQGYLQFLELAAYDMLVATLDGGNRPPPVATLVILTESDINNLGNWPLTDEQLHDILVRLLDYDPAVVGVDIYRDLAVPPGNDALQQLLSNDPRIIAIEKFPGPGSTGIPPPPALRNSPRVGFSDLASDPGGVIRRNLLFQSHGQRTGYSLSLRLALAYLAAHNIFPAPAEDVPSNLRLGEVTLVPLEGSEGGYIDADTAGYQIMLDYQGVPSPFPVYPLAHLLEGKVEPANIRGRILLLGVASESVKDYFPTPFTLLDPVVGTLSGSAIHAHAAQQLVNAALYHRQPLVSWSDRAELAWLWLWVGLGFLAGWFAGPVWRFVPILAAGAGAALAAAALAYAWGLWIPVVPNLLGWFLAAALSSALLAAARRRDQQMLMGLFASHVSPQVADAIWQQREEVLDNGRIRPRTLTVTMLFADLQGFTRISEQMEPEPFLEWLNSYLGALTDTIMKSGGVLDDYAGDGIKANFGIPIHDPAAVAQEAEKAIHCALKMSSELRRLNEEWRKRGLEGVAMRIGIHTGQVVAGTVGSASRLKYTTVGRHVNLASRLESLKEYAAPDLRDASCNCRILISADTAALLGNTFVMHNIGAFELKGINQPIDLYHVIGSTREDHDANN